MQIDLKMVRRFQKRVKIRNATLRSLQEAYEEFEGAVNEWVDEETGGRYVAEAAKIIYNYSRLYLPSEYKKSTFPLYRGLMISKKSCEKLLHGESLKLRAQLLSSWTTSLSLAKEFASGEHLGDWAPPRSWGVVVKLGPEAANAVVLNVDEIAKKEYVFADPAVLEEIIVHSKSAHVQEISSKNIVAIFNDLNWITY